jgi:3-oxoacyl-[acyl-carrier protein] reductase
VDELNFAGRTVCVIGGSSGIGNGIAQAFRARGATVHVTGTREAATYEAEQGSDLIGLHYARLDLSDPTAIEAFETAFDQLDALVLSQGTVLYGRQEFTREGWDRVMAINLDSVMACATRFYAMLAASRGSLITIGSVVALNTARGNPAYAASKAAVHHLTATLGEAWAADGIRVNGIAPGLVSTKLTAVTMTDPQRSEAAIANIPLGRAGVPEDIAGIALFLASPLAAFVIGQTIVADGGMTLSYSRSRHAF